MFQLKILPFCINIQPICMHSILDAAYAHAAYPRITFQKSTLVRGPHLRNKRLREVLSPLPSGRSQLMGTQPGTAGAPEPEVGFQIDRQARDFIHP